MRKKIVVAAFLFSVVCLLITIFNRNDPQVVSSYLVDVEERFKNYLQLQVKVQQTLPCCQWDENLLVGRMLANKDKIDMKTLVKQDHYMRAVKEGGQWRPANCTAKRKVAIIIPFRKREEHLTILLRQLHPMLQRQNLDYRIFIIDQVDNHPFNRAKLMNVGYNQSQTYDDYDCFVFHDVDLIPEDDRNDYGCPSSPRHMCPAVDKFGYSLFSPTLFGGVTSFRKDEFMIVNGFPNKYYGWGAEDDDMYSRVMARGLKVVRPLMEVGRYTMITHADEKRNGLAKLMLKNAAKFMDKDGLSTLQFGVKTRRSFELYTEIGVDLQMTDEERRRTTLKDGQTSKQGKSRKR